MVPNISRNGRSFRGAGAYHLHDKPSDTHPRPRTSHRLAFTATRNLANDDPHAALDEMWRTATDSAHLKAQNGLAATGRKNDAPVKTVSLAWAPGQTPTQAEMCATADSFLKSMGWHEHQALYVAHRDTAHPHLHIILNRVHPDTGRALNDWQDRKRAQTWALAYERQQGAILCPARLRKSDNSLRPVPASLPYRQAKLHKSVASMSSPKIVQATRHAFRPAWAAHYRSRNAALTRLDVKESSSKPIILSLAREGDAGTAIAHFDRFTLQREHLNYSFATQRAALVRAQSARLRSLIADERPLLFAAQAAGYATLRRSTHGLAGKAASRAHAEVAQAFAHRWAELRRAPAALRAAMAAALQAEQSAALSAHTTSLLAQLLDQHRAQRTQLRYLYSAQRKALTSRHRQARTSDAGIARAHPPIPKHPKPNGPTL